MSKLWKKNEVKVDIASYMHYIRGQKKVGKTTLFNDLVSYIGKGVMDKGLLISIGDEDGYKTLDGLTVAVANDWESFTDIVEELIENPQDNDFKFIALDTVDELINIAIKEVYRLHKKQKGETCESLNKALGGYGAGRAKVKELVADEISKLKTGYGLFCIGHTKLRDVNEKGMEESYQQLTTSLPFDFDSIFADKADVIATVSIDKQIVNVEEVSAGKDKTKLLGSIGGVTRWIHFRDDNFNVDCGARFKDIVDKVELSAENYITAIEDAIKKASGKNSSEIKEKTKKEELERVEKLEALKGEEVNEETNQKVIDKLGEMIPKLDDETKVAVVEAIKALGVTTLDGLIDKPTVKVLEIAKLLV